MTQRPRQVMAVASGGGHWVQLYRIRPAWDACHVSYVTTEPGYRAEVEADAKERGQKLPDYFVVTEANRWQKLRLLRQLCQILWIVLRTRPDTLVTTGAAPGYFAIRAAKLLGAKTIWIDSIANAQELSLSGQRAGRHADLWLTQWEHLAGAQGQSGGPRYRGSVL